MLAPYHKSNQHKHVYIILLIICGMEGGIASNVFDWWDFIAAHDRLIRSRE